MTLFLTIVEHIAKASYKVYAIGGASFGFLYQVANTPGSSILDHMAAFTMAFVGMLGGMLAKYFAESVVSNIKRTRKEKRKGKK